GRLSVKLTSASVTTALGLVSVKVSDDVPPSGIDAGAKLLAIVGALEGPRPALVASVALAVLPVPPLVEVTAEVVLVLKPGVVLVTLIENVQDVAAARVAPERLTLPPPAVAVMVPPPHEPVRPLGLATTTPEGSGGQKGRAGRAVHALGIEMRTGRGAGPASLLHVVAER